MDPVPKYKQEIIYELHSVSRRKKYGKAYH